jgi:hypothetical protein
MKRFAVRFANSLIRKESFQSIKKKVSLTWLDMDRVEGCVGHLGVPKTAMSVGVKRSSRVGIYLFQFMMLPRSGVFLIVIFAS